MSFHSILRASVGAATLFAAVQLPAQMAPDGGVDLWPMVAGNSWSIESTAGAKKSSQVLSVTAVTPGKDFIKATLEYHNGATSVLKETYRFNSHGVSRITGGVDGNTTVYPPLPIITYPIKSGSKWYWNGTIAVNGKKVAAQAAMKATGPEEIKVPAGTFQAYKLHSDLVIAAGRARLSSVNDYWFAPGVGWVQQKMNDGKQTIWTKLLKYSVKSK